MNLTKKFFASRSIPVDVIPVSGAAEVALGSAWPKP